MNEEKIEAVATPKRAWQSPVMEELDFVSTDSSYTYAPPFADFGLYSS